MLHLDKRRFYDMMLKKRLMMSEHIGKLLLRLMLGGLMLFHGVHKAIHGIGFIKMLVVAHGLPEFLAYGVYVGEILAPLLLLLGWKSRIWAGIIAFNMAVAIYLTQISAFLKVGGHGAWALEVPMFYMLSALALVFSGSGKYAIAKD
jgi:putative oxidoreductase